MANELIDAAKSAAPASAGPGPELSGPQWVNRFPGSTDTDTLEDDFRKSVEAFIRALHVAGVQVTQDSTFRPPERSYLMHWSWMIAQGTDPASVPPMDGVDINWMHPTRAASVAAAQQMVSAYGMTHLHTPPALHSLHNERKAIDMSLSWAGSVSVRDAAGKLATITTTPRTGMNAQIIQIGASYGVIKFVGGAKDEPHWSTTGH